VNTRATEALRVPRESPESPGPSETSTAHDTTDAGEDAQEPTERPWWRRMFGG
jgi:hypothetical protein